MRNSYFLTTLKYIKCENRALSMENMRVFLIKCVKSRGPNPITGQRLCALGRMGPLCSLLVEEAGSSLHREN